MEIKNKHGITWREYDKEIADKVKYYFDLKVGKARLNKVKSMWRKGHPVSDAISYILLSQNAYKAKW